LKQIAVKQTSLTENSLEQTSLKPTSPTQTSLMRHEFHIADLGQPRGWFRAHRYRYSCIRCGWAFLVEGHRGTTTALNEVGAPLPEPEHSQRVKTFSLGPCTPVRVQTNSAREHLTGTPMAEKVRAASRRRVAIAQVVAAK
jgi:hypothetical protein